MKNQEEKAPKGSIRIAAEAIAQIAGIAAREVEGVKYPKTDREEDFRSESGMKHSAKGVKCQVRGDRARLELTLTAKYGYNIQILSRQVQERVRSSVENMTGLKVVHVNVKISKVAGGAEA